MKKNCIKKAFQLNSKVSTETLEYANAQIKTAALLMATAREDMIQGVKLRDKEIDKILKVHYGYLLKPTEIVVYLAQLNKLCIYEQGTVGSLSFDESDPDDRSR